MVLTQLPRPQLPVVSTVHHRQRLHTRNSVVTRGRNMSLEPLESNAHSIRFKILDAEVSLVAVVEHILSNADGALPASDCSSLSDHGRARALELLQLGAVYVGVAQKGLDHITWHRSTELPTAPTAAVVPYGQYVRVHPHPKRYPACYCKDWPSRVLFMDEEYVVVNKPAGLPCMRHESNAAEELAACVGRALALSGLEVCHRLDQWTTGIVVLSRTKDANKAFKRCLQDREAGLIKTYKALSYNPVPLGLLEHHMYDGPFNEGAPVLGGGNLRPRGPRLLSTTPHERWRLCRLEVKECREHTGALQWYRHHLPPASHPHGGPYPAAPPPTTTTTTPQGTVCGHAALENREKCIPTDKPTDEPTDKPTGSTATTAQLMTDEAIQAQLALQPRGEGHSELEPQSSEFVDHGSPVRLYESTIDLHTGRTHQIRAQLAAVGCPLVGDVMYTPLAGLLVDESGVLSDPELVSLVEGLPGLERHIGLHAWRLVWRGQVFEAAPDWGEA